ncbi:MAG TPA: helicase SNF2 [Firmicutes bacterium]|jgi:SNF2 family DNA or RNA helicase|nr:helicase SNF2 [Bacillota bacterium]
MPSIWKECAIIDRVIFLLLENLKTRAGEQIYQRGVTYYTGDRIRQFSVTPLENHIHRIQAVVQGTKSYIVKLTVRILHNQLKIDSYCSCPYSWNALCKHEVAVLYKFIHEEYYELTPYESQRAPKMNGFDSLKQFTSQESRPADILTYELKGLQKLSGTNFRIQLIGGPSQQKAIKTLIEEMDHENTNSYLSERLLRNFDQFDQLVIEHLQKIYTRKTPEKGLIFFAKSHENLDFIISLLSSRQVLLDESVPRSLTYGAVLKPRLIFSGNERHLKMTVDDSDLLAEGFYHPDLDCLLKNNVLYQVENRAAKEIPPEFEISSQKLGAFLFEILPKLRQKIDCVLPQELINQHLNLIEPKIRLDFDYSGEQIICHPQIQINDQIYDDKDSLQLASSEPVYSRSTEDARQWTTIDPGALQRFVDFLEYYNFKVSPEGLTIKEPGHLIQFMINGLSKIPSEWQVVASQDFQELKIAPLSLIPVVELNIDDTINWFEFKISYNLGGKSYTHQEILKMMRQTAEGAHYIQDGQQIFLVDDAIPDRLEKELPKKGPNQEQTQAELYNLMFYRQLFQEQGIAIQGNAQYQQFESDIERQNLVEDCGVPESFNGALRPYQKEGFNWLRFLYKYKFNGILADDMGLGKTLQVLTLVKSLAIQKPHLVVCPRSLIYNWAAEIDKFYPGTSYLVYHGVPEERAVMRTAFDKQEIIITTYDILARDSQFWQDCLFGYCILDEAQHIKNHLTVRAREVKRIRADHRLVMTGTPIENGLEELWSIFDFLMPGYLDSQPKFTARYVTPLRKAPGDQTGLNRLRQKVAPFILRRRKEEVLTELPEKITTIQNVYMTKLQEDLYHTILSELKEEIIQTISSRGLASSHITVLAALTKLRQVCNHPKLILPDSDPSVESGKLEALMELIYQATDAGHKIVIFSQFVKMLRLIEGKFQAEKIRYEYLDGSTRDRMERINRFNQTPEIPIFLISLKAGGLGINLTSADIVIHVDPWWNPMAENQATDRVHRMGQQNQVMVYKLITMGTVEEKILQLQQRKKSVFDAIIENNQSPLNSLTWDDVKDLFEL